MRWRVPVVVTCLKEDEEEDIEDERALEVVMSNNNKSSGSSGHQQQQPSSGQQHHHHNHNSQHHQQRPSHQQQQPLESTESQPNQESNNDKIKDCIQQCVSDKSRKKINSIINEVGQLSDIEKLLLYIHLPAGSAASDVDPLKQKGPGNPFGKKADVEVSQTYTWIKSHLEEDPNVSLPKQEVYEEYKAFCEANRFEPLCVADFGKAMKHIFPRVKPRRLGQRGNSKYCYSGLKKRFVVDSPTLPDLDTSKSSFLEETSGHCLTTTLNTSTTATSGNCNGSGKDRSEKIPSSGFSEEAVQTAASQIVLEWAEMLFEDHQFKTIKDLGRYLIEDEYVDSRSVAALTLISSTSPPPERQPHKSSSSSSSSAAKQQTSGKSGSKLNLQRKLHQKELIKEQKKKLETSKFSMTSSKGPSAAVSGGGSSSKYSSKKLKRNVSVCKSEVDTKSQLLMKSEQESSVKVKVEQIDAGDHQLNYGTEPSLEASRLQNKVPIPRTATQQQQQQQQTHLSPKPSFIYLQQLRVSSGAGGKASQESALSSALESGSLSALPASPIKSSPSKYKRIQPKPMSVNRCNSTIESFLASSTSNSSVDSNDSGGDCLKRRHSVSVPVTTSYAQRTIDFDSVVCSEKQVKRPMEEKEVETCSKKRLVESQSSAVTRRNGNVTGSIIVNAEENLTSASLSPASQPEISCTQSTKSALNEDCGSQVVKDLEHAALLEYLRDNSANINCSTIPAKARSEPSSEPGCQTAQLSQLRKYLEQKLPQLASKNGEQTQLQGFSELRQALSTKSGTSKNDSENHPCTAVETPVGFESTETIEKRLNEALLPQHQQRQPPLFQQQQIPPVQPPPPPAEKQSELQQQVLHHQTEVTSSSRNTSFSCTNTKESNISGLPNLVHLINNSSTNIAFANVQTQFPSIPPSPNTRRRAFSFQPISPRSTPTIHENSLMPSGTYISSTNNSSSTNNHHHQQHHHVHLQMNSNNSLSNNCNASVQSPPQYNLNQHSVAVGPSQPPSAGSSPFVSPRTTPVPLSRSRHNSGQSAYSASRQTPYTNVDSGVSSISNSPFISPQSTPVPRVRVGSLSMQSRAFRNRHSSGPGNPSLHSYVSSIGTRSTSLSPMVSSGMEPLSLSTVSTNPFTFVQTERSLNSQFPNTGLGAANSTPISPLSEPMSPNATLVSTIDNRSSFENYQLDPYTLNGNMFAATEERARHPSSPYPVSPSTPSTPANSGDSQEVQNLLRNAIGDFLRGSGSKVILNRSHSVPVHQMQQADFIGGEPDSPPQIKAGSLLEDPVNNSKSHPATPLCNQSFQFPPSPPPSSLKLHTAMAGEEMSHSFLQSGHDVMVSGITPSWPPDTSVSNEIHTDNELVSEANSPLIVTSNPRRSCSSDLLTGNGPIEDDLQTTFEDLRDCDSDFSKFAQELEAMEANDGSNHLEDLT